MENPFKWRHFQTEIILLCVRWYLRYSLSYRDLKQDKLLPEKCKRRPSRYIDNLIEQDHRFMKRKIRPGLGFFSYPTAWRTTQGYEMMHIIRKGQIQGAAKGNIQAQNRFIAGLFGLSR